jgi:hypothetical protein
MGGIEVVTDQLRTAAKQIGAAADGVAGAHPQDLLDPVGPALVGSASAGAAGVLAGSWSTRFSGWVTDARAQQRDLDASAASYDGSDRSAADGFAPRGRGRAE